MLPFYELVIDDSEDTGVDFNAFVLRPAHGKPYFAFNKVVTGVMMSANTPIYRSNPDRFVLFKGETIKAIRTKFHTNGFHNNVNEEHNPDLKLEGVNMISSYIVSNPNHIPSQFKAMNLQNGTWIASYKIDNPTVWNKIKKGEFSGYSVEGYFDQKEIKLKQI